MSPSSLLPLLVCRAAAFRIVTVNYYSFSRALFGLDYRPVPPFHQRSEKLSGYEEYRQIRQQENENLIIWNRVMDPHSIISSLQWMLSGFVPVCLGCTCWKLIGFPWGSLHTREIHCSCRWKIDTLKRRGFGFVVLNKVVSVCLRSMVWRERKRELASESRLGAGGFT